jgi:hypothetical protein
LRNEGGNGNHWLGVTLEGSKGLSSGMGAYLTVMAGGKSQVLVNQWSMGYLSNNDPRLHVGLGKEETIERLTVTWPDGSEQEFKDLKADRYIIINKERGLLNP